jgi:hypothetical protein
MAFLRGPSIVKDGLVLYLDVANQKSYPGSGTTWNDVSGNSNNGTLTNGPTFDTGSGGSIVFDGSNDFIQTNLNGLELGISDTNFSGEIWIKKNEGFPVSNLQGHMGFGSSGNGFNIKNSNKYFIDTYDINNIRQICDFHSTTFFTQYQYTWLLLTFTFSENIIKTYSNGIYYSSITITGGLQTIQDKDFSIANGYGYYRTFGNISACKLYNRALTTQEILQNYNATKSRYGL